MGTPTNKFNNVEVLELANALARKGSSGHSVHDCLQELDRLLTRRAMELQSANDQLKNETAGRIKLENRLSQTEKMEAVGQLAASLIHDFNNLLTVVQGNASLMLAGEPPATQNHRLLQNICLAADRAAKLAGQLLTRCREQAANPRPAHLSAGEPDQTPPPHFGRKPASARETILVVDDEPDLRDLVSQVLETEGYQVLLAGSGAEALEQWGKRLGDVHLLLTDIVMPDGLTGGKLAVRLRKEDPRLRVIYTSGYAAGQPGTELAEVEERHFLPKPYRPATLLQVVRQCLDQPCPSPNTAHQAA